MEQSTGMGARSSSGFEPLSRGHHVLKGPQTAAEGGRPALLRIVLDAVPAPAGAGLDAKSTALQELHLQPLGLLCQNCLSIGSTRQGVGLCVLFPGRPAPLQMREASCQLLQLPVQAGDAETAHGEDAPRLVYQQLAVRGISTALEESPGSSSARRA
jgi:hypothetical protein